MKISKNKDQPEWIFGYGSLMWDPGFPHAEKLPAILEGYHRAFCVYSHHYRGTTEQPGLVLGLNLGGKCRGIAFRISSEALHEIITYLDERELIGYAYKPKRLPITFDDGTSVLAHTYIADQSHPHFAGSLSNGRSADLIISAKGAAGTNRDYALNAIRALEANGVVDTYLQSLLERLRQSSLTEP